MFFLPLNTFIGPIGCIVNSVFSQDWYSSIWLPMKQLGIPAHTDTCHLMSWLSVASAGSILGETGDFRSLQLFSATFWYGVFFFFFYFGWGSTWVIYLAFMSVPGLGDDFFPTSYPVLLNRNSVRSCTCSLLNAKDLLMVILGALQLKLVLLQFIVRTQMGINQEQGSQ